MIFVLFKFMIFICVIQVVDDISMLLMIKTNFPRLLTSDW